MALLLVVLSLASPWDGSGFGADRVPVVLTAVLVLLAVSAPYIVRSGALSRPPDPFRAWLIRLLLVLPYLTVVITTLVLDIVGGRAADHGVALDSGGLDAAAAGIEGGFGSGLGIGLAGAVLALSPRAWELFWVRRGLDEACRISSVTVAALTVLCLLLSTVLGMIDRAGEFAPVTLLGMASLVLSMVVFTVPPFVGIVLGDPGWRRVVIWLGAVLLITMVFTPAVESIYRPLSGLVFWPAAAVFVAAPGVLRTMNRLPDHLGWLSTAGRALELIAATGVAGFIHLLITLFDATEDRGVRVMMLIFSAALVVGSLTARAVLRRDPGRGRPIAVTTASVFLMFGVVGIVVRAMVAESGVPGIVVADPLLISSTFGLPALVVIALTVPSSVRGALARPHTYPGPTPSGDPGAPQTGPIRIVADSVPEPASDQEPGFGPGTPDPAVADPLRQRISFAAATGAEQPTPSPETAINPGDSGVSTAASNAAAESEPAVETQQVPAGTDDSVSDGRAASDGR